GDNHRNPQHRDQADRWRPAPRARGVVALRVRAAARGRWSRGTPVKLDRRHMVASVIMLVGSILYNVWVFTGGSSTSARNQVATAPGDIAPTSDARPNARG